MIHEKRVRENEDEIFHSFDRVHVIATLPSSFLVSTERID